jgi:putative tryptophan/tyrosine transport system substrate-binding protein
MLPNATRFAVLAVREDPMNVTDMIADMHRAAATLGLQVEVLYVSSGSEFETSIAGVVQKRAAAVMITPSSLFLERRAQIAMLALREGVPAIYANRNFPEAGGLMSYGSNWTDTYRQSGIYCGRILHGAKPADLPVMQPTKFELVINRQTARALGIEVPERLLATADKVIE